MRLFYFFIRFLLYYLSYIICRTKTMCIYGGALDKVLDNAKYCFIYGNKVFPEIKHIWLTKDNGVYNYWNSLGYKCVKSNTVEGLYYSLISKYYIYDNSIDDFAFSCLTGGAIRCNLWHGIPLKKIGYDVQFGEMARKSIKSWKGRILSIYAPTNFILTTSHKLVPIFSRAFNVCENNVIVGGYHRTIPFFLSKNELMDMVRTSHDIYEIIEKLTSSSARVIIYMPTFRDANNNFIEQAIPDFDVLNNFCRENNILFVLKLHRFCKVSININTYPSLLNLDPACDIYSILPFTDMLITDYSSIMFDYELLKKPIIYYPYDLEEYKSKSRELYFEFYDVVKENVVTTFQELLQAMVDTPMNAISKKKLHFFDRPTDFDIVFNRLFQKKINI